MAKQARDKRKPGEIRDAIIQVLKEMGREASVAEIHDGVSKLLRGPVAASSVRSYLGINAQGAGATFRRTGHGRYALRRK